MGSLFCFSCLLLELWSLIVKNYVLLAFFADISNKSKAIAAVHVCAFESSCFNLLENGIGYYAMKYSLEDISVWRWWTSFNFCWFSTFCNIFFLNISWTVGQTLMKHTIFWRSMMSFNKFRVRFLLRFRFLFRFLLFQSSWEPSLSDLMV